MRFVHWLAGLILAIELPVPIYWFVVHGAIGFWRGRGRAAYWVGVAVAWGICGWLLYHFLRPGLFAADRPPWAIVTGVTLMLADVVVFSIAESELGGRRLVGHAELTGSGEVAVRGLYAYIRHPRYLGMMLGVLGVCVLAGSPRLWAVSAIWCGASLAMIRIEERELRARFGTRYISYAARVPMLLPLRFVNGRK